MSLIPHKKTVPLSAWNSRVPHHSSHLRDKWEGYRLRDSYRLRGIVDRVDQRFNDSRG